MGGYWKLVFVCCLLVQHLSAEESMKDNSTSAANDNSTSVANRDEELEKNIGQRIASLQEMGQDEMRNFADLALQNFNTREGSLFTTLGDVTVKVKKAVGSMVTLQMTVEKTNCTKKDVKPPRSFDDLLDSENEEPRPKYCGPLDGHDKEQLDCKFDIFKDERCYREVVVSHDCKPVKVVGREIFTHGTMKFD